MEKCTAFQLNRIALDIDGQLCSTMCVRVCVYDSVRVIILRTKNVSHTP